MKTISNLSGGRDSTAMVVRWLELGNDLDYIIFCDTGFEFPQMYEYIEKLQGYLQRHFNKSITILDASKEIEKYAFEYPIQRGEHKGRLRGIPKTIGKDFCTREAKINPTQKFLKSLGFNPFVTTALIGYTHNEVKNGRVSNLAYAVARYPLDEWEWNEPEVTEFLKSRGIMNPLYNDFSRTGCFFCPKQSVRSLKTLYEKYPEQWETMKEWEARAQALDCVNKTFRIDKPLIEYEKRFKENKGGGVLFSNTYADFETCFCK